MAQPNQSCHPSLRSVIWSMVEYLMDAAPRSISRI